ncbi:GTPase IMAP family member 8-like [Hoplias malabaricus]|uniref:GTPase IMAP family member 8-like n=1 Tax=Hoplias malabaricus TaxID=27720 RepID=UPI003461B109
MVWERFTGKLRAVVLGGRLSGKTLLINAVFGNESPPNKKRTAQCKKVRDNVCGRDLTLVDTPGWWKHYSLSDIPNFLKQELVRGVSLCDPGPHAVLLVIELAIPFTEKHRQVIEDHLGLLGGQIWTYALVVFTRCHALGDRTIEEHIETEGESLQWVIERCGNRYHVFDSADFDTSQVTKLLEKIEDTVQRNKGSYFQIGAEKVEAADEWKKTVKAKAESRVLKLQQQKKNLTKEELRITLLGWVISGKSSAGNVILNRKAFAPGQSTLKYVTAHREVDGRPVTVLETPSWFKYFPSQYTPEWIKSEILKSVGEDVTCLLLVIPADTSFKEEQRKVIQEKRYLGEHVWRHTIVLFTWGDILGDLTIEEHIESEGEALQWVIEKCGNRYHVFNNEDRENCVQVTELLQKIDEMVASICSFQLNTETVSEFHAGPEVDTQLGTSEAESDLQDIVRLVDEEWRRRDAELLNRFSKFITGVRRKTENSTDVPFELSLCDPGPHAVLVVIEIDVPFTEKHRKAVENHIGLLGDQIWKHTLVVFTRSYALKDRTIEEHIETEGFTLKPLQWVMERCGNRYHVFDSADFDTSQVMKLLEKIEDTVQRNNELRITLLGWVVAGKSSTGNVILNRNAFLTGQSTLKCVTAHGEVDGRPVTVLDTPSWFKYFPSQYTPESIKSEILKSVGEAVTCLLLVIPADTSFKEEQRKVIQENMRLLGEQVWRHTIVLGDLTIEEHIVSEGEALQWMIEKCGNRYHVFNNDDRENRVQVTELLQKIDKMMASICSFQLNTETLSEMNARPEVDTQADTSEAEGDLQDIVTLMDEEWRRRDEELLNRFSKLITGIHRKTDRCKDVPSESKLLKVKKRRKEP